MEKLNSHTSKFELERGFELRFRAPTTKRASDRLEVQIQPDALPDGPAGVHPGELEIRALQRECARHIEAVIQNGVCYEPDEPTIVEALDTYLSARRLHDLAEKIISAGRLTNEQLHDCRAFAKLLYKGGCECKRCVDGEPNPEHIDCAYEKYDTQATRAVLRYRGFDPGDTLDAPPWAYDVVCMIQAGRSEARDEKDAEHEEYKNRYKQYDLPG